MEWFLGENWKTGSGVAGNNQGTSGVRNALGFAKQHPELRDLSKSCWSRWVLLLISHLSGSELCYSFNSTSQELIPGEIIFLKAPPHFSKKNSDFSTTSTSGHSKWGETEPHIWDIP